MLTGGPNGNRTRVSGVRGQRPRPLDDGTKKVGLLNEFSVRSCKMAERSETQNHELITRD